VILALQYKCQDLLAYLLTTYNPAGVLPLWLRGKIAVKYDTIEKCVTCAANVVDSQLNLPHGAKNRKLEEKN